MKALYEVTREFTGGLLKGLTHTETTTVKFDVGFICEKPCGGDPYRIISVKPKGTTDQH